jgi:molybdopterin molybdotransferase
MTDPRRLLDLDDARARVAKSVTALDAVTRPVEAIRNHVLAAKVVADVDLPPADVSAMDGYAARADELRSARALPVAMEIPAGQDPHPLPTGAVARIFTGAPLPPGADVVVPQEQATLEPAGHVRLEPLPAGSNVRRRGELFTAGRTLLDPGERITPSVLALVAGGSGTPVTVVPRPGVAVLTTGSELVPAGTRPEPGQIRDSNGPLLRALAREADLEVRPPVRAVDDLDALSHALASAFDEAEVVVTAGGVSVGDHDLVPAALSRLGGEVLVHGVAMRPGKPILIARRRDRWLVGLPGNPVAAQVGWRLFVRPLVEALAGDARAFDEDPIPVVPVEPVSNPGARLLLHPARVSRTDVGLVAELPGWRGSHDTRGSSRANALVRIPGGTSEGSRDPLGAYPLPWRHDWLEASR